MTLSVAYFPPVSWFAAVAWGFVLSPEEAEPAVFTLEACENYQKQSWRNRCRICAASGPENLLVPVVHEGGSFRIPITEIRIDYSEPWPLRTERTISSAYETSAYFEYYKDGVFSILESRFDTLWELDMALIRYFLDRTGILAEMRLTTSYRREIPGFCGPLPEDLREVIHPKRPNPVLSLLGLEKPYFQVFARKYGFLEDMSVMDLLFNEGPSSIMYLKSQSQRQDDIPHF